MKRSMSVSLLLLGSLALVGCIPNEASVVLLHAVSSDGCQADPGGEPVAQASIDVAAQNAYLIWPFALQNNMQPNDDESSERLDSRGVILERAEVSFTSIEADLQPFMEGLGVRATPLAQVVNSNDDAAVWIELIPHDVANALASRPELSDPQTEVTVLATVRVKGRRQDGQPIASSSLQYPIRVCNGCVFDICGASAPVWWSCSPGVWTGACGTAP